MLKGILMWRGDGAKASNGVGTEGLVGRGAIYRHQERFVAPEDEDSPGSGRAMAPGVPPPGEPGREPPMVVGAEERVEWAG